MKKIICNLLFIIVACTFLSGCADNEQLSQEKYNQIDAWLMNYYKNYFNADNWYVKNTNLKFNKYVVVNLVAADDDYVITLLNNQRAAINFAQSVCPNDNEEIYNLIDKKRIDVDVFDRNGNFLTASSCY